MPITPTKYFVNPFAKDGDVTPVPDQTQPDGTVSYDQGYGGDYALQLGVDPNAKPIDRAQNNQILKDITQAIQQYQIWGTPNFITTAQNLGTPYPYPKWAYCLYDASDGNGPQIYQSLVNSNTALPTVTSNWKLLNAPPGTALLQANNLSDVADVPTSRKNLSTPGVTSYSGNPNGHVAGAVGDFVVDISDNFRMWQCTVAGTISTAVWVYLAPSFYGAQLLLTADLTVNTTQNLVIPFNTKVFDTNNYSDISTFTMTSPGTGFYTVNCRLRLTNSVASSVYVELWKGNGVGLPSKLVELASPTLAFTGSNSNYLTATFPAIPLIANDYLQIQLNNVSANTVLVKANSSFTFFLAGY